MIASCNNCGTKTHADNPFCQNCGHKVSNTSKVVSTETQDTSTTASQESTIQPDIVYQEQTMTLRVAIFVLWFGIFMSAIFMAVFFVAFLPSILVTLPLILVEVWIAFRLSQYNRLARYGLILISIITLGLGSYTLIVNDRVNWFIMAMAVYELYAMVLHKDTVELFSGKYQPDPDYGLFTGITNTG